MTRKYSLFQNEVSPIHAEPGQSHGFAVKICELAKKYVTVRVKEVEAIATAEYLTPAKRLAY
jgi:hypothetical protein